MHFTLSIILFVLMETAYVENLKYVPEEQQGIKSVYDTYADENETVSSSAIVTVSDKNGGLATENLTELHDLAKNISHTKGIYRETEKEAVSEEDLQIRRSVLRKIAIASESDVMNNILRSFDTDKEKLQLLEKMEFLVHQYDVAVNFATQGGIEILAPFLSSSDDKIVSSVASVLGAAMQSNPTVQKLAMQCNICGQFLKLLSHKSPIVTSRILFALSCFLRNSLQAQEEFISLDGVSKLADVLRNNQMSTNSKLKVINLFSDLAVEQQTAKLYPSDQDFDRILKLERCFANEMKKCRICKLIPQFLDFEDFDTHQKIVSAMLSVHIACRDDFKNQHINNRLKILWKIYHPHFDSQQPVYPIIDKDLKRALHNDINVLFTEINEKSTNKSTLELLKTEL